MMPPGGHHCGIRMVGTEPSYFALPNSSRILSTDDFGRRGTIKRAVANILGDQEFHCRTCLKSEVDSDQIAGGSGIQGLKRAGYVMEKETRNCRLCSKLTTWDRWTGKRQTIISTGQGNISDALKMRVFNYYRGRDPVLDTQLHPRYALVDHRLPMIRWGDWAPSNDPHKQSLNPLPSHPMDQNNYRRVA